MERGVRARSHWRKRRLRRLLTLSSIAVVVAFVGAACGSSSSNNSSSPTTSSASTAASSPSSSGSSATASPSSSAKPVQGGSVTVLTGSGYAGTWPGLDPGTNIDGAADQDYMNSIFGQLFELGPGGKTIPDLATGYKFSNGNHTITIDIRKGVTFSDGTPFNAAAVVFNWDRDLKSACTCKPTFPGKQPVIKQTGPYTLQITTDLVDAPFITGLQGDIFNWIASPTALKKMGEKAFSLKPVGAGPFEVKTDILSSLLVLVRNPHYWQKGLPYLDQVTYKPVASDEAAYEAMLAGTGQIYEGLGTPQLVPSFKKHFTVTQEPSTSPYDIQLNTLYKPFNNKLAREAIYYATNAPLIDQKLFGDTYPVTQSFTAAAGLFYEPKVPGYLTYNLAKAKAIVKQLGGLTFTLGTLQTPLAQEVDEALQAMWQQAGMKVTLREYDLSTLIAQFDTKKWQAMLQTAGAFDPALGVGVAFRFQSISPFSGVHDPEVDKLLNEGAGTVNMAQRAKYYAELAAYLAKQAYGPFLFPISGYNVAAHGIYGPGLTTPLPVIDVAPAILWQYVYAKTA